LDLHSSLSSPAIASDRLAGFSFGFLIAFRLTAVVKFLALRQRQFAFGAAASKIDLQRHKRETLLLNPPRELIHFAAVKQKFSRPERIVVPRSARPVFRNVAVLQPDFASAHFGIGLAQTRLPIAQRLDLGSYEDDAGLNPV